MAMRRRTTTPTSPLAKAGQMLGGLLGSRTSGTTQTRSRGGRRRQQPRATGLSRLLHGGARR